MERYQSKLRRSSVDISLVPLIDIFFNIMVFFLLTTSFAQQKFFDLELPGASSGGEIQSENILRIEMDQSGNLALNDVAMTQNNLFSVLSQEQNKSRPVLLEADHRSSHGKVIEILDTLRQQGFVNLGVSTMGLSNTKGSM